MFQRLILRYRPPFETRVSPLETSRSQLCNGEARVAPGVDVCIQTWSATKRALDCLKVLSLSSHLKTDLRRLSLNVLDLNYDGLKP